MENNKINMRGTLHVTDWLNDITYIPPTEEVEIVQVLFKNTRSAFFRNPEKIPLKKGDWVTVEASPGHDIGQVMLTGPLVRLRMKKNPTAKDSEIKQIYRLASEEDIEKFKEARAREHTTMIRSRQIAAELGLNMKIGDVEFQGDGAKAIFYYIADERVDFRKLIRILADTFKIRIEMKQIGARQEAGRIGGIGPCGRPLCCSSWMSRFVSVGTGAARIQDLSMNPQKLAGQCGKLKCCLNFETESYAEASKDFPPKDAVLITTDQEYYQFKTDILARTVTYSTDRKMPVNLVTISVQRAKEIININKQGEKPEQLEAEKSAPAPRSEYVELVGQDSLTRFDKKKKKKKSGGNRDQRSKNAADEASGTPKDSGNKNPNTVNKKGTEGDKDQNQRHHASNGSKEGNKGNRRQNHQQQKQRQNVDMTGPVRKDYSQAAMPTPARQRPVVKPRQGRRASRNNNSNSDK